MIQPFIVCLYMTLVGVAKFLSSIRISLNRVLKPNQSQSMLCNRQSFAFSNQLIKKPSINCQFAENYWYFKTRARRNYEHNHTDCKWCATTNIELNPWFLHLLRFLPHLPQHIASQWFWQQQNGHSIGVLHTGGHVLKPRQAACKHLQAAFVYAVSVFYISN